MPWHPEFTQFKMFEPTTTSNGDISQLIYCSRLVFDTLYVQHTKNITEHKHQKRYKPTSKRLYIDLNQDEYAAMILEYT